VPSRLLGPLRMPASSKPRPPRSTSVPGQAGDGPRLCRKGSEPGAGALVHLRDPALCARQLSSNRKAERPVNALLNYVFALLEAEAIVAC
jgi:hypothetical protein